VAIRLIALVYVGRVIIEVIGLVLREVLLAEPEKRSEAEQPAAPDPRAGRQQRAPLRRCTSA
jgi:hypothetical protein